MMTKAPNLRLEAAFFFAAACLVMVLAANYRIILGDIAALFGREGATATGESWGVLTVGVIVAALAYGGAFVILVPAYEFLAAVLQRREGGEAADESLGKSPSRSQRRASRKQKRRSHKR